MVTLLLSMLTLFLDSFILLVMLVSTPLQLLLSFMLKVLPTIHTQLLPVKLLLNQLTKPKNLLMPLLDLLLLTPLLLPDPFTLMLNAQLLVLFGSKSHLLVCLLMMPLVVLMVLLVKLLSKLGTLKFKDYQVMLLMLLGD